MNNGSLVKFVFKNRNCIDIYFNSQTSYEIDNSLECEVDCYTEKILKIDKNVNNFDYPIHQYMNSKDKNTILIAFKTFFNQIIG